MSEDSVVPNGWCLKPLSAVADINPPRGYVALTSEDIVHFVPMASVTEEFGGIDVSLTRPCREVIKGYTAFRAADVLFAKITPCMENGKIAVVPPLGVCLNTPI